MSELRTDDSRLHQEPIHAHAGFGFRLLGWLVDWAVLFPVGIVLYPLHPVTSCLLFVLVRFAYRVYYEGSPSGQTIGKRVVGIRVVDHVTAEAIGYGRAALRHVGRFFSYLWLCLGYFWMLWDPRGQTWHDKIARTLVVRTGDFPVARRPG